MPSYADLTPCDYFGSEAANALFFVGWLSRDAEFNRGQTPAGVYERLKEFALDPWQPIAAGGSHGCELCQHSPEARGSANLFIPSGEKIYVTPELIVHYINAHQYLPPDEFCAAVLNCPAMRSMAYKRLLLKSGWNSQLLGGNWPTFQAS
jgi:hypothetical protein